MLPAPQGLRPERARAHRHRRGPGRGEEEGQEGGDSGVFDSTPARHRRDSPRYIPTQKKEEDLSDLLAAGLNVGKKKK